MPTNSKEKKMKVKTPRQIIDMIKKQTQPRVWSKDLKDWYVAEIVDLVNYNIAQLKEAEERGRVKATENIISAYDKKIKEYQKDGLTILAKLMIDVRDIALDQLLIKSNKEK